MGQTRYSSNPGRQVAVYDPMWSQIQNTNIVRPVPMPATPLVVGAQMIQYPNGPFVASVAGPYQYHNAPLLMGAPIVRPQMMITNTQPAVPEVCLLTSYLILL